MIKYIDTIEKIKPEDLKGFWGGWSNSPSAEKHWEILKNSEFKVLAVDSDTGKAVGFVTAISDGVLSAYIPFLEVLPKYRRKGVASELMKRMLEKVSGFYMIDLTCDQELQKFYEKFGMKKSAGMMVRNLKKQSGR